MGIDGNLLQRFIQLQKALLSSLHLKDVLDAAVVQLADLSSGGKVALFLADNESLALKLMASKGYSDGSSEQLRVMPFTADSLLKFVVQKRQPTSAVAGDPAPNISANIMKTERSSGQIALPLLGSNLLVGALLIDVTDPEVLQSIDFLQEV